MGVSIDKWIERQLAKKSKAMPWNIKLLVMLSGRKDNRIAYKQLLQSAQKAIHQSHNNIQEVQQFFALGASDVNKAFTQDQIDMAIVFALIHSSERLPIVVSDGLGKTIEACDYLHYKLPVNSDAILLSDTLIVDETESPIRAMVSTIVRNGNKFVIRLIVLRKDGIIEQDVIDVARMCSSPINLDKRPELEVYSGVILRAYTLFRYAVDEYSHIMSMSDMGIADQILTSIMPTAISGVKALQLMRLNEKSSIPRASHWYNRCITGYLWDSGIDNFDSLETFAQHIGCLAGDATDDKMKMNMEQVPESLSGLMYSLAASSNLIKCPLAFEYNNDVGSKLRDKYMDMLSTPDSGRLIREYAPGEALLIHNVSNAITALVYICDDKDGGDTITVIQLGVTTSIAIGTEKVWDYLYQHHDTTAELFSKLWDIYKIPEAWVTELCDSIFEGTVTALCALLHICNVRRVTALRRAQKNQNGDASTASKKTAVGIGAPVSYKEDHRVYGTPIRLYSLTPRTVVKQKVVHAEHARGWTMPVHTRAAHYRNVWVGSGKDRHKEMRLIPSVVVNKDKNVVPRVRELQL